MDGCVSVVSVVVLFLAVAAIAAIVDVFFRCHRCCSYSQCSLDQTFRVTRPTAAFSRQVNRVILDDSSKLVGVRLPITSLPILRQHLAEAVQARQAVVDTGGGGKVDPVSPVDPKILLQVKTPPKNILSFFGRAPSASTSSPLTSRSPSLAAATPSPAGRKRQMQGRWTGGSEAGVSGSGDGDGGCGNGASSSSRKRRNGSAISGGKGEKENKKSATSVAKGHASLFGARSGGSCSSGGSGTGVVQIVDSVPPRRKDETPEVISIDDD